MEILTEGTLNKAIMVPDKTIDVKTHRGKYMRLMTVTTLNNTMLTSQNSSELKLKKSTMFRISYLLK